MIYILKYIVNSLISFSFTIVENFEYFYIRYCLVFILLQTCADELLKAMSKVVSEMIVKQNSKVKVGTDQVGTICLNVCRKI